MNSQDFRSLQEAYREVYTEAVDSEGRAFRGPKPPSEEQGQQRQRRGRPQYPSSPITTRTSQKVAASRTSEEKARQRRMKLAGTLLSQPKEQVDIYDIILSHLLDEGYAETPEAAEAIMVNMSEEWRDSIINL
jgi:hypothetical protein